MNFEIDFRAIRLFRLLLGAVIAIDMIQRILISDVFYSDGGVLPRALFASKPAGFTWISPFFAFGSTLWSQSLFVVMLMLGLILMLGFKARTVSFLLFFLTVGMHVRAPMVTYGADVLTRVMLFWSIFLPTRPSSPEGKISNAISAAVLIQLSLIYIFAGWFKSADAYFYQANAAYHTISLNCGSALGREFLHFPGVLRFLSRLVFVIERFGWVLFFVPWKKDLMRFVAFALFTLLHGGLFLGLNLGLFPFLSFTFLVLLLPGSAFPKWAFPERKLLPENKMAGYVALLFLAVFIYLNLATTASTNLERKAQRIFFVTGLSQSWNFFAPSPSKQEEEWIITARLANGDSADLMKAVFPESAVGRVAFDKYLKSVTARRSNKKLQFLAQYACTSWNRRHPDSPVTEIQMVTAWRTTSATPEATSFRFVPVASFISQPDEPCEMRAQGSADFLKPSGLRLNPKLKLQKEQKKAADQRRQSYQRGDLEVNLELLPLHNANAVSRISEVQMINVKSLFQPHKSPYRGQITRLVQCEKAYEFQESTVTLTEQKREVILGGANARRQIGACARDEIRYWTAYFNYRTSAGDLLTVQLLIKADRPSPKKVRDLSRRLKKIAQELFLPDSES